MCHQHGAKERTCNIVTGQCECRSNVIGLKCNTCQVSEIFVFIRLLVLDYAFIQLRQHLNFYFENLYKGIKACFEFKILKILKKLNLF